MKSLISRSLPEPSLTTFLTPVKWLKTLLLSLSDIEEASAKYVPVVRDAATVFACLL